MTEKHEPESIFKKHIDTIIVMGGILGSFLWMQGNFSALQKDVTVIKTVLLMQNLVKPEAFAYGHENGRCHICGAPIDSSGECANGHRPNPPGPDPDRDG